MERPQRQARGLRYCTVVPETGASSLSPSRPLSWLKSVDVLSLLVQTLPVTWGREHVWREPAQKAFNRDLSS